MAGNRPRRISGRVVMTPKWFRDVYGIEETDPFATDLDVLAERNALKSKLLYDRYPDLPMGDPDPIQHYPLPQYDSRIVCGVAYGAPLPIWNAETASFWHNKDDAPWGAVETVSDVAGIKVPKWDDQPLVQQMIKKLEEVKSRCKGCIPSESAPNETEFRWTDPGKGTRYRFTGFTTFIDATFLCGDVKFFTMLACESEVSRAMMEKLFEIATDYSDYLARIYDRPVEGICCFGGDNSCVLSPKMYEKYVMRYDEMLAKRYQGLPCLLHSCGASIHLYDVWATYPEPERIILTQTRAVPGSVKKLRECMPETYLQLTIHQPQFDFERESPENICSLIWQYAKDVDFHDLELIVLVAESGERVDRSIRAFYKAIDEVNDCACNIEYCKSDNNVYRTQFTTT